MRVLNLILPLLILVSCTSKNCNTGYPALTEDEKKIIPYKEGDTKYFNSSAYYMTCKERKDEVITKSNGIYCERDRDPSEFGTVTYHSLKVVLSSNIPIDSFYIDSIIIKFRRNNGYYIDIEFISSDNSTESFSYQTMDPKYISNEFIDIGNGCRNDYFDSLTCLIHEFLIIGLKPFIVRTSIKPGLNM